MSDSLGPHGHQAAPSMGFSRQEYWSGLPFPSPENLPDPGIESGLPHCRQMLYRPSHQGSHQGYRVVLHKYLLKGPLPSLYRHSTRPSTFASVTAASSQNTFDCRCDTELKRRRRGRHRSLCEKGLGEYSPAALLVTGVALFLLLEGQEPRNCLLTSLYIH